MAVFSYSEMMLEDFNKIESLNDLAILLRIKTSDIKDILYQIKGNNAYLLHQIEKRGGGYRTLFIPTRKLRKLQRAILVNIIEKINLPPYVHGGIKKHSIITNAKNHIKRRVLLSIDIQDFFPSLRYERIGKIFLDIGFNKKISNYLQILTTAKYCLPQGAPTSPYLSNLAFLSVDRNLYNLSIKNHLRYTRYFDDIAISGNNIPDNLVRKFYKIIKVKGFKINYKKSRKYLQTEPHIVTGIMINDGLTLPEEQVKEMHELIWELKNGIFDTQTFIRDVDKLRGKINFLISVDKNRGMILKEEFENIKRHLYYS